MEARGLFSKNNQKSQAYDLPVTDEKCLPDKNEPSGFSSNFLVLLKTNRILRFCLARQKWTQRLFEQLFGSVKDKSYFTILPCQTKMDPADFRATFWFC